MLLCTVFVGIILCLPKCMCGKMFQPPQLNNTTETGAYLTTTEKNNMRTPDKKYQKYPYPNKGRFFKFGLFPFMGGQLGTVNKYGQDKGGCGRVGTKCVSSLECTKNGGQIQGYCSGGYYVCCSNSAKCGSTIKSGGQIFLTNDNFPEAVTTLGNCQYIIEKTNEKICQLKLEMENMVLSGPGNDSQCLDDRFTLNSGTGESPIVLCGENSGQHLHVNLADGASSVRINIATTSSEFKRTWKIKVKQIPCSSPYKAPPDCLQYFTDFTGSIKSFNYQESDATHQLGGLKYTICIMSRPGFCGITFKGNDFSLSDDATSTAIKQVAIGDDGCLNDFVSIFTTDKLGVVSPDRYCGNLFNDVTTYSKPFEVRVVTNNDENDIGEINNRGFDINYVQLPC